MGHMYTVMAVGLLALNAFQEAQFINEGAVARSSLPLDEPAVINDMDATVLVTGLDSSVYKDISVTNALLYALTTVGIKRVALSNIPNIESAPYLSQIQLDAIDFTYGPYRVVGARSKGSNPHAALVLKSDTATPVTLNLPEEVDTVLGLRVSLVESGNPSRLRILVKTVQDAENTKIIQYDYDGASLTRVSSLIQSSGEYSGFTTLDYDNHMTGWRTEPTTYAYRQVVSPSIGPEISEAQNYERTYTYNNPGTDPYPPQVPPVTTAYHAHGFQGSAESQLFRPLQVDAYNYTPNQPLFFGLNADGTGRLAIVRLSGSKTHFEKTPAYEPAYWDVQSLSPHWYDYTIVNGNNCYNYATNKRTDTFAQPGRAAGVGWGSGWGGSSVQELIDAIVADGIEYLGDPVEIPVPPAGKSLIAAITGGGDFHFYRKDRDAPYWSHKIGIFDPSNLDGYGELITDPRVPGCIQGLDGGVLYDTFVGFFLVDSNWYQGMGTEDIF